MIYVWHIFSLRKNVRLHYYSIIDIINIVESEGGLFKWHILNMRINIYITMNLVQESPYFFCMEILHHLGCFLKLCGNIKMTLK